MSHAHSQLKHVAIIPDGNGRWARKRLLPRAAGHHAGAQAVRRAVEFSLEHNLQVLSLFALSVENYQRRPPHEVQLLLSLFLESLQNNIQELNQKNVRLRIIGDHTPFGKDLLQQIESSERITENNTGLQLVMALNYSGRWDIAQAAKKVIQQVMEGKLSPNEINDLILQKYLSLSELPEPDLLIRTGNEQRISNYLLWQFAYTELFFMDIYWPDFDRQAFQQAVNFYYSKQRRFGRTGEQVATQYA